MIRIFVYTLAILCSLSSKSINAQQARTPISHETLFEVMKLGSLAEDIDFLGPDSTAGQVILVKRKSATRFDERSQRIREVSTYLQLTCDDTSLKAISELEAFGDISSVSRDGKRQLWKNSKQQESAFTINGERRVMKVLDGYKATVEGSKFNPKKETVAVNVREYDPEEEGCLIGFTYILLFTMDGMQVRQIGDSGTNAKCLGFSPNGELMLVLRNSQIQMVDLNSGKTKLSIPTTEPVNSCKFHPDEKMIAILGPNNCQIWNCESGKPITEMELKKNAEPGGVLWSQNGDLLMVARDGKLRFWETKSWSQERELDLFYRGVTEFMMTPDGSRLIVETRCLDKWNPKARMVESWGLR